MPGVSLSLSTFKSIFICIVCQLTLELALGCQIWHRHFPQLETLMFGLEILPLTCFATWLAGRPLDAIECRRTRVPQKIRGQQDTRG